MLGRAQVMQRDRVGPDERQEQPTSARVSLSGSQLGVERLTNEAPRAAIRLAAPCHHIHF